MLQTREALAQPLPSSSADSSGSWQSDRVPTSTHLVLSASKAQTRGPAQCDIDRADLTLVGLQTKEALAHALASGCPIVVALTKCDLPGAQPERVRRELMAEGLELEEAGGDVQVRACASQARSMRAWFALSCWTHAYTVCLPSPDCFSASRSHCRLMAGHPVQC